MVCRPLVPTMPLVGAVQVSFLSTPNFDFDMLGVAEVLDIPLVRFVGFFNRTLLILFIILSLEYFHFLSFGYLLLLIIFCLHCDLLNLKYFSVWNSSVSSMTLSYARTVIYKKINFKYSFIMAVYKVGQISGLSGTSSTQGPFAYQIR